MELLILLSSICCDFIPNNGSVRFLRTSYNRQKKELAIFYIESFVFILGTVKEGEKAEHPNDTNWKIRNEIF